MVGGKVIGLARGEDSTLVHVEDPKSHGNKCSVRVVERRVSDNSKVTIELGDSIWWQCGHCMWTPKANCKPAGSGQKCGVDFDIHLPKLGYSH